MRLPSYPLDELKQLFPQNNHITQQAVKDAHALGLDGKDIERIICEELKQEHFFKTMPAKQRPGHWQDVYKLEYLGVALYLKLQLSPSSTSVVVISCKEDESPPLKVR